MKKILFAAVALAALAAPVTAQQWQPVQYGQQTFNWTGLYGGLDIGGAWGHGNLTDPGTIYSFSRNASNNGVIGGAYLGTNYQISNFVFGVQGQFDGTSTGNSRTSITLGNDIINSSFNQNWIFSIDGRAGYAIGNFLPYAIGGLAFNSQSAHVNNLTTSFYHGSTSTPTGYDVGFGVEYAITPNWLARAEYRYYNFGSSDYHFINSFLGSTHYTTTLTDNVARVGISYKFF